MCHEVSHHILEYPFKQKPKQNGCSKVIFEFIVFLSLFRPRWAIQIWQNSRWYNKELKLIFGCILQWDIGVF